MSTNPVSRVTVNSSSLASIGHSADDNILIVEFKNGSIYRYLEVPAHAYDDLVNAESKGAHFNRFVRSRFAFERVPPRSILGAPHSKSGDQLRTSR